MQCVPLVLLDACSSVQVLVSPPRPLAVPKGATVSTGLTSPQLGKGLEPPRSGFPFQRAISCSTGSLRHRSSVDAVRTHLPSRVPRPGNSRPAPLLGLACCPSGQRASRCQPLGAVRNRDHPADCSRYSLMPLPVGRSGRRHSMAHTKPLMPVRSGRVREPCRGGGAGGPVSVRRRWPAVLARWRAGLGRRVPPPDRHR